MRNRESDATTFTTLQFVVRRSSSGALKLVLQLMDVKGLTISHMYRSMRGDLGRQASLLVPELGKLEHLQYLFAVLSKLHLMEEKERQKAEAKAKEVEAAEAAKRSARAAVASLLPSKMLIQRLNDANASEPELVERITETEGSIFGAKLSEGVFVGSFLSMSSIAVRTRVACEVIVEVGYY
ncbi:hypothetical protein Ahy_B10g104090 isoform A [Arachis hypogaea]|uniref:Uncharacterized protein n=1 Tax=Arachis hypogaea TaxID=3818 RepID=A0A444X4P0_ARAHY|nr:hypothetical protein Ahy_B10g104090 isoform A [Arachis hypogaea]